MHMADATTSTPGAQYARPGSPVEARQKELAREYLFRTAKIGRMQGTLESAEGPVAFGSRVLIPVFASLHRCPRT